MNDKDWNESLTNGKWAEDIVANYIKESGFEIIHFNKTHEYDILAKKKARLTKFEVKLDQTNLISTINIEFRSNGINSGITTTTADYYLCLQPQTNELMIIATPDIKTTINEQMLSRVITIARGGFNNLAQYYNFNKADITNKRITIDWKKYEDQSLRPEKLKHL